MYIKQSELFGGMDKGFLKQVMQITLKESHGKGGFLFREGDPATYSYVLLRGHVDLILGETGHVVFVVNQPGETFGWSCFISRDVYTATAVCREPTRLLKMHREDFQRVLEKDAVNGVIFYRQLAVTLGNRLLECYKQISAGQQADLAPSFGTGQILESSFIQ